MINYIKAELYRNFNRKYFWGYTASFAALAIIVNVIFFIIKDNMVADSAIKALKMVFYSSIVAVPFIILGFVDFVTAEENKSDTVRNVLTFGLSRPKMVFSKMITTTILALISQAIILSVFFILYFIFIGVDANTLSVIELSLQKMLVATPLWIASICMATFLAFMLKNSNVLTMVYLVIIIFGKPVVIIISTFFWSKFKVVENILITSRLMNLVQDFTKNNIIYAIVLGLIYIILFTGASVIYMNKKEIK